MSKFQTLDEPTLNTINNKKNNLFENYVDTNQKYTDRPNLTQRTINQSWDFTPFPKFLFPHEKKHFLTNINRLNFPGVKELPTKLYTNPSKIIHRRNKRRYN